MSVEISVERLDFRFPQDALSFVIQIPFSNHYESIHVNIERFREHFYLCSTRAVSCCGYQRENITDSVLDLELDKIFSTQLGVGYWLNLKRSRDSTPSTLGCSGRASEVISPCEHREKDRNTSDVDGVGDETPFAEKIGKIKTATLDLYKEAQALKTKDVDTRAYKQKLHVPWQNSRKMMEKKSRLLIQDIKKIRKTRIPSQIKEQEKALMCLQLLLPTTQFCGVVKSGVSLLRLLDDAVFHFRSFRQIIAYRNSQSKDLGQIQQVLEQSESDVQATTNTLVWASKMLASGTRIIRRNIDKRYMEARDLDEEKQLRRKDSAFETIHKIVNKLHGSQNGNAWLVYGALEMQGSETSVISRVSKEAVPEFVTTIVSDLASYDWASVSDEVTIFHLPAVLSWTLCMSFEKTCENLGLAEFSHENPGIATELDDVAKKFMKLDRELPTLPKRRVLEDCAALEREAHAAMRVSLGKLRAICKKRATDITRVDTIQPADMSVDTGTDVSNTATIQPGEMSVDTDTDVSNTVSSWQHGGTVSMQQAQLPNGDGFGGVCDLVPLEDYPSESWFSYGLENVDAEGFMNLGVSNNTA
ncbi:hypothetical protein CT0861_10522 [Colletotrichum tofieldiae]|uniref:Uncharacterized protein n=1 Tax=Colletotrichum tofieldiae TaxID=708197 RepID=A0A166LHC9_9PEZI|nr:hypothetical protein CT0861_10522 [Colletotrichum tofieldiae]